MAKKPAHKWAFSARFRRHAYGWKSQPAIKRIREAVSEIKKVRRSDPELAAEGAVLFIEKLSPAIEQVDSSSGAIGGTVYKAIEELAAIIAEAPADTDTRQRWLDRLFEAHAADDIPYIENLADYWGPMCAGPELASQWADQLMDITRTVLTPDKSVHSHFHGTTACLSSLYTAERFDELIELLKDTDFWDYKRWSAMALAAQGKRAAAVKFAENSRSAWASDHDIDQLCEQWLIEDGRAEHAYKHYGLAANRAGTYAAWFRKVAKKYPDKAPETILHDLVNFTPGEEGKWFAAAKDVKLFDEAIKLANSTPCSPQTLTRAARDFQEKNPSFAVQAGLTALRWLSEGYGYEVTSADMVDAYTHTMSAAVNANCVDEARAYINQLLADDRPTDQLFKSVITRRLSTE
jgi:hypothetical protein